MKNLCILVVSSLVWAIAISLPAQGKFHFEKVRHDFGDVKEEMGPVTTIFSFENKGNRPASLISVKASCGCTTPVWSKDSIMPGSKGYIKVEFNPQSRPGTFKKEITVETSAQPAVIVLGISGKVIPRPKGPQDFYPFEEGALRFRSNHLTFGSVYKDEKPIASTVIYNQGKKTIQFSKSGSKIPPHVKPSLSKNSLAPGDTLTLSVVFDAASKDDWGFTFDNIFLSTNDPDKPMKRLNISAEIKERFPTGNAERAQSAKFLISKTEYNFGMITEGEMPNAVFEFKNTGKSNLIIRKLSAACSCITVESSTKSLEPGGTARITLTFNSRGRLGEFEKDAQLICNDPDKPEIVFQVKGKVVRERSDSPQD